MWFRKKHWQMQHRLSEPWTLIRFCVVKSFYGSKDFGPDGGADVLPTAKGMSRSLRSWRARETDSPMHTWLGSFYRFIDLRTSGGTSRGLSMWCLFKRYTYFNQPCMQHRYSLVCYMMNVKETIYLNRSRQIFTVAYGSFWRWLSSADMALNLT